MFVSKNLFSGLGVVVVGCFFVRLNSIIEGKKIFVYVENEE